MLAGADVYVSPADGETGGVSLRSTPITRRVALPDGRSVELWVGVPEDSYVARRELDTVALELRDGNTVIATLNTVLDAADDDAANELARDVAAKLESGELEPTATALEPLADEPR
jgi:hypothetical protein